MDILLLPLVVIAWVAVPGALLGWLTGFINWHPWAAIFWALIILITYPRTKLINDKKIDFLTIFLALIQACTGGAITYIIGQVTH